MREDMVGEIEDVVRDRSPVVKMERNANSINDMPREAPKVSKDACLRERGMASALACLANRHMLKRKKTARGDNNIGKGPGGMRRGLEEGR